MKRINADFDQRVLVHSPAVPWINSPMPGVARRPLDRVGDEVARATSIVRYTPDSHFSPHVHHGGEEFLVLEGIFQDEHGDYPAGSYLRNPPGSSHTPGSEPGCIIFVKLWQFEPDDIEHVRLKTTDMEMKKVARGVSKTMLFHRSTEEVAIFDMAANTMFELENPAGIELFMLSGDISESGEHLAPGSWLRLPPGPIAQLSTDAATARFWMKQGNLKTIDAQLALVDSYQT